MGGGGKAISSFTHPFIPFTLLPSPFPPSLSPLFWFSFILLPCCCATISSSFSHPPTHPPTLLLLNVSSPVNGMNEKRERERKK